MSIVLHPFTDVDVHPAICATITKAELQLDSGLLALLALSSPCLPKDILLITAGKL